MATRETLNTLTRTARYGDLASLIGLLPETNHLARHVQISEIVQLKELLDVVLIVLQKFAQIQTAGVVDQYVDVLKMPFDLVEFALDHLLIGDIEIGNENVVLGQFGEL